MVSTAAQFYCLPLQFNLDMDVYSITGPDDKCVVVKLSDLLPRAFTPRDLEEPRSK